MSGVLGFFKSAVNNLVRVTDTEPLPVTDLGTKNGEVTLVTLAAQGVGTVSSADQTNVGSRGVTVIVDITAITGTTPTLTVVIEGKDPASGKYFTLLSSAALNAVATTVLSVYPGLTASANVAANAALPKTWRVRTVTGGTGPSVTATIGACVID